MAPIVDVRDLIIAFDGITVVDRLSFAVAEGESLAIIGPTGSGKTALFRALIGTIPYLGSIRWAPGATVGYVPQKLDIERDLPLSGRDFLRARARLRGVSETEIRRALDLVSLTPDVVRRPIGTLSGGQFQRLLLAFAFLGRPSVLLFDEPTAGIDEPGQEQLYERIHRLQEDERFTLLLISHELSLVYRYATRVLCLGHDGRSFFGPPTEVLTPQRLESLYGAPMKYHVHP